MLPAAAEDPGTAFPQPSPVVLLPMLVAFSVMMEGMIRRPKVRTMKVRMNLERLNLWQ